jgi:NitT/TauT family transport system ATP-binding protein
VHLGHRTLNEEAPIANHVLIRDVAHAFDDTSVLQGINLQIAKGSFVALLGPSGCGKSTLLRLIAGLNRPTQGSVEVVHAEGPGLSVVFQEPRLLPWRTVVDNVALPLELNGMSRTRARTAALAPLAEVELSDALDRYPDQLSGGMKMRVSIARALVTEPSLLLLDEPFAALDELTRQRLDERLRALWLRRRMTVVFVTHSLSEATFLAGRALVMSKRPGRIVLDHALRLPEARPPALRTSAEFVAETKSLFEALEAHGV